MKSKQTQTALMRALEEILANREQVGPDEFTAKQVAVNGKLTDRQARSWCDTQLRAGVLQRRMANVGGKITAVYRYVNP